MPPADRDGRGCRVLLHTWSLARPLLGGRLSCLELTAEAAMAGFDGVEWLDRLLPSYDPGFLLELGQSQRQAGLGPAAYSMSLEMGASPARLAEQVDRAKAVLGLLPRLRVAAVRVCLGGGGRLSVSGALYLSESLRGRRAREAAPLSPLSRAVYRLLTRPGPLRPGRPPAPAEPMALQSAAWALQPLARQARDLGLSLGVENHRGLAARPEDLLSLLDAAGEGLGVCLDLGNLQEGIDRAGAFDLLAPAAVHVHFKTSAVDPAREAEAGGYAGAMAALARAGYGGAFAAEYQGAGDGLSGARAGAALCRRLWEEAAA